MLNIDEEYKKIKDLLDKTTTLKSEIIPYFDWGNKVSIKVNEMIDNKKTAIEYYFHIKHCKDRDNYCNAEYFLSCDYDYNNGGGGYGEKYESIDDFKNTRQYKELLEKYGKNNIQKQQNKYESISLFDIDNDEEDNEVLNVLNDNQISIFDLENDTQDNQLSLSFEINNQKDPVEDLLSYGIDDYYMNNLRGETFGIIKKELNKIPKYKEYYNKLKDYLSSFIPKGNREDKGWNKQVMFVNDDDTIIIRGNRQQCPIYVYKMYENSFK